MIKNILLKFAYWLLAKYRVQVFPIPNEVAEILPIVRTLVRRHDQQSAKGTSEEWKRDRVYNQVANTVPNVTYHHIHMAILLVKLGV